MISNDKNFDIAIIGDGFCSLVLAAHLVRAKARILVVGRTKDWGPGLAYGRCHPHHLLNVPSARMGAYTDKPDDFLNWLKNNISAATLKEYETPSRSLEKAFVPRAFYGQYLRGLAKDILPNVTYIDGGADDVNFSSDVYSITTPEGIFSSKILVLATGVPAPTPTADMLDPWRADFSQFKNSEINVVISGTGLTMIDVVSSLFRENFKGKIIAASRRGLIPREHAPSDDAEKIKHIKFAPLTGSLAQKMKIFRANIRLCMKENHPWQAYFDLVRPHIPQLWQDLTKAEQKKFLTKILPYWNVFRHRQPQYTVAILEKLTLEKRFELRKGHASVKDAIVFNCRGSDYALEKDSFLQKLLNKKLLRLNQNNMGVEVDENLRAHENLYVAGSLTAGNFLESTAVPELRAQCAKIAAQIQS